MAQDPALLDRCLKVLTRHANPAIFRLFGAEIDPAIVHFEDVALNLPEHRADDLLVVDAPESTDRWALLLEACLSELTVEQALELQDRAAVATSLTELGF